MADTESTAKVEQKEVENAAGDSEKAEASSVNEAAHSTQADGDASKSVDLKTSSENMTTDKSKPTALEAKIIRQVEYYFNDANLERDKFLIAEIKKDEGWVTLKVLLTFNRLKAMSEEPAVIMAALRKSSDDLLELKDDDTAIRRHPTRPLPSADNKQEIEKRILYVKGFPTDQTLDDLIEYFDQFGGESVSLRKDAKRLFKGSVFIRFKTDEQAKAYLEPEEMKYKDTPLMKRMLRTDYFKMKQATKFGDKQEEVKRKEEMKKKREQEEKEEFDSRMTRGALLKVTGLGADTSLDKLKEFFGAFGKVAWVDYEKGGDNAIVRFGNENGAKEAWGKAVEAGTESKVLYNDKELTSSFLEGDEEERHWRKVFEEMKNKYNKGGKKFGRGGHRGGRGGFKRRNAGGDSSETGAKKAKAEDG